MPDGVKSGSCANGANVWSSSEYNSNNVRNVNYNGNCNNANKNNEYGVAPVLDILIYAEPVDKVFAQGAMAAVANILTAVIVGALLIAAYTKTIAKKGSLEKQ